MLQTKISGTLPVSSMEGSLHGGQNPLEGGTGLPAALISLYIFKYRLPQISRLARTGLRQLCRQGFHILWNVCSGPVSYTHLRAHET